MTHRVFKHGVFAVALAFAVLTAGAAAHAQERDARLRRQVVV